MAVSDSAAVSEDSKGSIAKFGEGCYLHNRQVSASDLYDRVSVRLSQALAMLTVTFGEGEDSTFNRMAHAHQDNYLWCIFSLVEEAQDLLYQACNLPDAATK